MVTSGPMDAPIQRRPGTTLVSEVPSGLGPVKDIRIEGERIVCKTESGIPFICGQTPRKVVQFSRPFAQGD